MADRLPIDTAPKNGSVIDLWVNCGPEWEENSRWVLNCKWAEHGWLIIDQAGNEWMEDFLLMGLCPGGKVTHWRSHNG